MRRNRFPFVVILFLAVLGGAYLYWRDSQTSKRGSDATETVVAPEAEKGGHGESEKTPAAPGAVQRKPTDPGRNEENHEGDESHGDEVSLSDEAMAMFAIRTEPLRRQPLTSSIMAPARVTFNQETITHIGSPVEGRVAAIPRRIGETVKKGDVLLVLHSPALGQAQGEFLQKRAEGKVAEIGVGVTQAEYQRAKALYEGKGISQSEYLRREAEHKRAVGESIAAQAGAEAAENTLHLYGMTQSQTAEIARTGEVNPTFEIHAPMDGQIIEREASLGEVVGPDDDKLMIVADLSTVWVIASIPESQARRIAVGVKARIQADALGEVALEGRLAYLAPAVDEKTRAVQARVEVVDGKLPLRPGMFATAEISEAAPAGKTPPSALAVPREAVFILEGEPAVFVSVPGEKNTFAKRAVGVGEPVGGMTPILAGLEEGQEVVVSGGYILKAELGKEGAGHDH